VVSGQLIADRVGQGGCPDETWHFQGNDNSGIEGREKRP
jgi:hypothetical protein